MKQRLWTNRPWSHKLLESISTFLIEPFLQRIRAGNLDQRVPAEQSREGVVDHVPIDVEPRNVLADVLLLRVAQQVELGLVGPQDDPVRSDPVQRHAGVVEEIGQLPFASLERQLGLSAARLMSRKIRHAPDDAVRVRRESARRSHRSGVPCRLSQMRR